MAFRYSTQEASHGELTYQFSPECSKEILAISMEKARVGRHNPRRAAQLTERETHLYRLLDQIDGSYPFDYLSEQGFLPSYAFLSDTARLIAKDEVKKPVLRNMAVALREYAPGNTVYMDGRKYQIIGLDFHRSPLPDLHQVYKACETCDFVTFDPAATHCLHCQRELMPRTFPVLFATSFIAERAEAIGSDEEYRQRAFYGSSTYLLEVPREGDQGEIAGVSFTYHRRGTIFVTNRGLIEEPSEGFRLCRHCGHWHAPTNRTPFEDHKLLHNRRQACSGNAERYHLGYRFQTDVLILHFQGIPTSSDEFFTSLKAAVIDAANTVVGAESGEISGFTRTMQMESEVRRELVLYDDVPGGAGYVRKAAAHLAAVLATARTVLDGCQCEKSCYKCLRSYDNQFEHRLLDKKLIQPYLDHLLVFNSTAERSRLEAYEAGSQRSYGSNPSAWLQRKCRAARGDFLAICSEVDASEVQQATSWVEFLVACAKEHPSVHIQLGLTRLPNITAITEHNFLAAKALLDLMAAGIQLFHISPAPTQGWHIVCSSGEGEPLAAAILDTLPALSTRLDTQSLVSSFDIHVCQAARERLQAVLRQGRLITAASLSLPYREPYRIVDIADGERGVTYEKLFRQYLAGARWIRIVDPYVRLDYQVQNVEGLLNVLETPQGCQVELVTMYERNDRYGLSEERSSRQRLDALQERLAHKGITFSYIFDSHIHDRCIETEQWHIILGRGLDFYYPPEPGRVHLPQSKRAKKCRMIFLPRTSDTVVSF